MTKSRQVILSLKNVLDKNCRENQNTHLMVNKFSRKSCLLRESVQKYFRAEQAIHDKIIGCKCTACWISQAIDTHSEYVLLIAFLLQQWLH